MRYFVSIRADQDSISSFFRGLDSLMCRSPHSKPITVRFFNVLSGQMSRHRDWFINLPSKSLLVAIVAYKFTLSPLFTGSCRFVPSCSSYACEAVARHGALKGGWLAIRRLARCHPLCKGGLDQVPKVPRSACRRKTAVA